MSINFTAEADIVKPPRGRRVGGGRHHHCGRLRRKCFAGRSLRSGAMRTAPRVCGCASRTRRRRGLYRSALDGL